MSAAAPPRAPDGRLDPRGDDSVEVVRSEEELRIARSERGYGRRACPPASRRRGWRSVPVFAEFVEVDEHEVTDPLSDSGQIERRPTATSRCP